MNQAKFVAKRIEAQGRELTRIWNKDRYLAPLIPQLGQYQIISIDIFDTLLMRTCYSPEDIFERTAEEVKKNVDFPYSAKTYKSLRIEAANRARQKHLRLGHSGEYTFNEIFQELPFNDKLKSLLMQAELEQEKEAAYFNENIFSFIQYCKNIGKTVVLTSNMYFSKQEIQTILENCGFDNNCVDEIYTSSDYNASKTSGELFRVIMNDFPHIVPHHIIHIGDNQTADIAGAEKAGIHSLYYGAIPQAFGSLYDFEQKYYKSDLGEISSLRKLAGATLCSDLSEKSGILDFFYRIGAEIIGPTWAFFAEWVVDFAVKQKIDVILPLMREGELLSRLVNRITARRGIKLECYPFFVSRHPLFAASICNDNIDDKLNRMLINSNALVKHRLDTLGIDISQTELSYLSDFTVEEIKDMGKLSVLKEYLFSEHCKTVIISYAETQRKLLLRYIESILKGRSALTADIGMKGTSQNLLHEITDNSEYKGKLSHVIAMGSDKNNVDNIMNGVPIFTWLGFAGENTGEITRLFYQVQILETLISATCGTVLRYARSGNDVVPVLDDSAPIELQNNSPRIEACWKGIASFQDKWFSLSERKPELCDLLLAKKRSFISIWRRVVEIPTLEEAEKIGELIYEDPYTWKNPVPLCGIKLPNNINDREIDILLSRYERSDSYWPQAAVVKARPEFFLRRFIHSCTDIPFMGAMVSIIEEIQADRNLSNVVIFAAAQRGRDFYTVARLFSVSITCFVDSNKALHGKHIEDKEIVPLETLGEEVDAFVVASAVYPKEIIKSILFHYKGKVKKPKIFSF